MNQAEFFIQAPSTGTVHLRRAVLIYDGQQGSALATTAPTPMKKLCMA